MAHDFPKCLRRYISALLRKGLKDFFSRHMSPVERVWHTGWWHFWNLTIPNISIIYFFPNLITIISICQRLSRVVFLNFETSSLYLWHVVLIPFIYFRFIAYSYATNLISVSTYKYLTVPHLRLSLQWVLRLWSSTVWYRVPCTKARTFRKM
jgi:hypothetical protein